MNIRKLRGFPPIANGPAVRGRDTPSMATLTPVTCRSKSREDTQHQRVLQDYFIDRL